MKHQHTVTIHEPKLHIHPGSAKVRGPETHAKLPTLKGGFSTHKKFNF